MDLIGNLRKTFDLEQIQLGLESLNSKTIKMASKEIQQVFEGKLVLTSDHIKVNLSPVSMSILLKNMGLLKSSSVFYFFNDDKSFVMKIAAFNFIFEKNSILFNSPKNALLPERRKEPRRTVINTFGFLVKEKSRFKITFIDFNENGCRVKLHKKLNPELSLKNKLDFTLTFKNHTREYACEIISINEVDNFYYIGIQFLERVYERMNLLPLHLEFN